MRLIKPNPEEAKLALRAFRAIMLADPELNELTELQLRALNAAQIFIAQTDYSLDEISKPVTADELANGITNPALRQQFVEAMVIMSVVNGTPKVEQVRLIQQFSEALDVDESIVDALHKLVNHHKILYAIDVVRNMYIGEGVSKIWKKEKFKGLYKMVGAMQGFYTEPELADRYFQLEHLPEGTLGKSFWQFYKENKFPFPGEKYGSPTMITNHDMAHILGGYPTTPAGELQVASFTAGFRNVGRAWILLFIISEFHLGVRTTPIKVPILEGQFNPEESFLALQRGTLMNVDLFDNWDYWKVMDRQVDDLRHEYNIVPPEQTLDTLKNQEAGIL